MNTLVIVFTFWKVNNYNSGPNKADKALTDKKHFDEVFATVVVDRDFLIILAYIIKVQYLYKDIQAWYSPFSLSKYKCIIHYITNSNIDTSKERHKRSC